MRFANEKELEQLRREFPVGCRVVLDEMDDPYRKLPVGGQGTCKGVDDAGNVLVNWDCGSSLNVAFGADRCHRVASEAEIKASLEWMANRQGKATRCPRCGRPEIQANRLLALSRRADITICETCGTQEALEDASMVERMPLSEWAVVKEGWKE